MDFDGNLLGGIVSGGYEDVDGVILLWDDVIFGFDIDDIWLYWNGWLL